jgi:hypothetical protein
MDKKMIVETSVADMASRLTASDYDVLNETEFCNIFFSTFVACLEREGHPLNRLRSEIHLFNKGRIDFGLRSLQGKVPFEALIEAKVWIRPLHVSHMSNANVATKKRNECVADAIRLSKLVANGSCSSAAILLLERNSTHLRRLLSSSLEKEGLQTEEKWTDLKRASAGDHQEHVGIIWIGPNNLLNPILSSVALSKTG